jgi:endonuclease/exonuclease/phosphatase family metal-dependent hydrolase
MPFDLGVLAVLCLLLGIVEAPTAPILRVVSYNVHYAGDEDSTLDTLGAIDADVVLLQETTPAWERVLRRRFAGRYPHMAFHHWRRGAGGLAVLSRHAVTTDELLPPAEHWFPAQRLVVAAPGGPAQVLHVHLRPAIDQGDWVRGFFSTPPIRRREIEAYWKRMASGMPTLVAGDFNEEPGASALGFLADRGLVRVDSGELATWEWKGIWKGAPVHLRMKLDHVLADRHWRVRDAHVVAGGGSDHRPVVVTLERVPS